MAGLFDDIPSATRDIGSPAGAGLFDDIPAAKGKRPLADRAADYALGLMRAASQGLTFNYGDEISGAGTEAYSALRSAITGDPYRFGEQYAATVDRERRMADQFRRDNPLASTTAETIGSVVSGVAAAPLTAGAAAAGVAPSFGRQIMQGAATGGTFGGLAGFGSGQGGVDDRLMSAAGGAAGGAAVGGAIPAVVGAVRTGTEFGRNLAGRQNPVLLSDAKLLQAFERDGMSANDALRAVQSWKAGGANVEMLIDAGGENVRGLARASAGVPGPGRQTAVDALVKRHAGQGGRIESSVNRTLKPDEFYDLESATLTRLKAEAKKLYDIARESGPSLRSERLDELLARPPLQTALRRAAAYARAEGKPIGPVDATGVARGISTDTAHYTKTALDDMMKSPAARNQLTGETTAWGRILTTLKTDFVDEVERLNPAYKTARLTYAGDAEVVNALRDGRGFLTMDREEIARRIAKMSFAEKDAWNTGVSRALMDIAQKTPDSADAAKRLFNNELMRGKIEAAFGDKRAFARFERDMLNELRFYQNAQATSPRAGSQTDLRAAERADAGLEAGPAFWWNMSRGNIGAALSNVLGPAITRSKGLNKPTSAELARTLFNMEKSAVDDILQRAISSRDKAARDAMRRAAMTRAASGGAGAAIGAQF
ncbi:MAG: hypothetical protein FJX78_05920 [Armatimonadetes bacterium]|nr:hypothetical protein [Armatimonadota bacterium]